MTIHEAAMYLLENVGVGGVTLELCKIYKDLGCDVNLAKIRLFLAFLAF
jgi:trimethylamine:corrinoid methyltransferase-like protein